MVVQVVLEVRMGAEALMTRLVVNLTLLEVVEVLASGVTPLLVRAVMEALEPLFGMVLLAVVEVVDVRVAQV